MKSPVLHSPPLYCEHHIDHTRCKTYQTARLERGNAEPAIRRIGAPGPFLASQKPGTKVEPRMWLSPRLLKNSRRLGVGRGASPPRHRENFGVWTLKIADFLKKIKITTQTF